MFKHYFLESPDYSRTEIISMRSAYQKLKDSSNSLKIKFWPEADLKKSPRNCFLANISVLNISQKNDTVLLTSVEENWNPYQALLSLKFVVFVKIAKKKRTFEVLLNSMVDQIDIQLFVSSDVNRLLGA